MSNSNISVLVFFLFVGLYLVIYIFWSRGKNKKRISYNSPAEFVHSDLKRYGLQHDTMYRQMIEEEDILDEQEMQEFLNEIASEAAYNATSDYLNSITDEELTEEFNKYLITRNNTKSQSD